MLRIAQSETAAGSKLDLLRVLIVSAFFAGMAVGLLMALGLDAAFPGYHPALIDTDVIVKESPAVADPSS
ncbi:hypothetical protein [Vineibacter terrae]|uniref:hypothetical protein n=1 Tax=Vineibacter terrae TaxID=2586908 RepID=UPI002E312454|nr:hypothetical protein [Vineibacter terrae]HEX2891463.1 hypothetical protein [Vineibacter terrae]